MSRVGLGRAAPARSTAAARGDFGIDSHNGKRSGSFNETAAKAAGVVLIPRSKVGIIKRGKERLPYREETCDEENDCSWIRSAGIRSRASARARHARSSRRPRELFASLHGSCRVSCRIQRRRGESALCPSCGAPHRSPDSPPPLLSRENDAAEAWQVAKECRAYRVAAGKSLQPPLQRTPFWRARGFRVKCATFFR